MNRGTNYTVECVLQRLQTDQLDDSCDENEQTELQDKKFVSNCCASVKVMTVIPTAVKTNKALLLFL